MRKSANVLAIEYRQYWHCTVSATGNRRDGFTVQVSGGVDGVAIYFYDPRNRILRRHYSGVNVWSVWFNGDKPNLKSSGQRPLLVGLTVLKILP